MAKFSIGDKVKILGNMKATGLEGFIESIDMYDEDLPHYNIMDINKNTIAIDISENILESLEITEFERVMIDADSGYYVEMATIAIDEKLNINVGAETERLSIAYFKVLNAESFRKATKVARLHFKDSDMEYHTDRSGKQPWILNSKEIKKIVKLLKSNHTDYDGYTNWQIACYQWNLENGLIKQGMHDYFSGKYDHMYDNDNRLKEAYVPSTQEMPGTWEYETK